jgi:PAS domain-containing protein
MDTVDLSVLGTVLFASALSAYLALYVLSLIDSRRRYAEERGILRTERRSVIFLFEDDRLIDATGGAKQLLAVAPREGSAWTRLVQALLPRFPNLDEEMRRLVDAGALSILSNDGQARLEAEWRHGLARSHLVDVERQKAEVAIDRHSLAALEGELEVLRSITDRVPYLTWKESSEGQITWANSAYLDVADRKGPGGPLRPWPPRSLFAPHDPESGEKSQRLSVTLPGERRNETPVAPRPRPVQGQHGHQRVRHALRRQNPRFDATRGAHEVHVDGRRTNAHRVGQRERWIKVSAGTTAREQHLHSVLRPACRAMFIRSPTAMSETSRLDLP